MYRRHKEILGSQFGSVTLVLWAWAILSERHVPSCPKAGDEEGAAWCLAYLWTAFQQIPFEKFALHLSAKGKMTLHLRQEYRNNVRQYGALVWIDLLQSNSAARTTHDSVKQAKIKCSEFGPEYDGLKGWPPVYFDSDVGEYYPSVSCHCCHSCGSMMEAVAPRGIRVWGVRVVRLSVHSGARTFPMSPKEGRIEEKSSEDVIGCKKKSTNRGLMHENVVKIVSGM